MQSGTQKYDAIQLKEAWGSSKDEIRNDLVWRAPPQKQLI